LAGACGEWNGDYSALIRPDERQARPLVQHARADHVTGVTHAERERAIHSRQRADFKRHALTNIVDDPNIARSVGWIDALTHDPA
jgi:hypothetical protein